MANNLYTDILCSIRKVISYYNSNGYFKLKLIGDNIEIIFSGCNCGYKGEGSITSFEILKYLFEFNNINHDKLLEYIECNHLFSFDFDNIIDLN